MYGFNNLEAVIDAASEMEKTAARGDYFFGKVENRVKNWLTNTPMGKRLSSQLNLAANYDRGIQEAFRDYSWYKSALTSGRGMGDVTNLKGALTAARKLNKAVSNSSIAKHLAPSEHLAASNKFKSIDKDISDREKIVNIISNIR